MNNDSAIVALQRAIALVMSDNLDYKKIVQQLAQHYPETFVKLATNTICEQWHRSAQYNILQGERVPVVKLIREKTGFGLKEALDVCHAAQNMMYDSGKCHSRHDVASDVCLTEKQLYVAQTIANAD